MISPTRWTPWAGVALLLMTGSAWAARWEVSLVGQVPVTGDGAYLPPSGMSGATYWGPGSLADGERFAVVQDDSANVLLIDTQLSTGGGLEAAVAIDSIPLSAGGDGEGIAVWSLPPVGETLFLADEATHTIRRFGATSGTELSPLELPSIFSQARPNRSIESLTIDRQRGKIWSANEEALSLDGDLASSDQGTDVRIVEWERSGNTFIVQRQYAYRVDPVHANHLPAEGSRSGLVDLAVLPDGTLLALERSLGFSGGLGLPSFENRIYELDLSVATDVSTGEYAAGLVGQSYTRVEKELLWKGSIGSPLGQNMEGLAVGRRNSLIGVVDDGDLLSGNTFVQFSLAPQENSFADGDFNANGLVDQGDLDLVLLHWGQSADPPPPGWWHNHPQGVIDQNELDAVLLSWGQSNAQSQAARGMAVPEASAWIMFNCGMVLVVVSHRRKPRRRTRFS